MLSVATLAEVASGDLRTVPTISDQAAVCVVMAAEGYPGSPRRGDPISGLPEAQSLDGVTVFHAGTGHDADRLVTAGGRVLGVTGVGPTLIEARHRAYAGVGSIRWPGARYRTDIALAATEPATPATPASAATEASVAAP